MDTPVWRDVIVKSNKKGYIIPDPNYNTWSSLVTTLRLCGNVNGKKCVKRTNLLVALCPGSMIFGIPIGVLSLPKTRLWGLSVRESSLVWLNVTYMFLKRYMISFQRCVLSLVI